MNFIIAINLLIFERPCPLPLSNSRRNGLPRNRERAFRMQPKNAHEFPLQHSFSSYSSRLVAALFLLIRMYVSVVKATVNPWFPKSFNRSLNKIGLYIGTTMARGQDPLQYPLNVSTRLRYIAVIYFGTMKHPGTIRYMWMHPPP